MPAVGARGRPHGSRAALPTHRAPGPGIDHTGWVVDPFAPVSLGPLRLRNRFLKAATFEGRSPDGMVTDELLEFHGRMADGGVAMTTVAYLAVSREGRGAPGEIVVEPAAVDGLRRLVESVHARGALASAQLGHAGPVAMATGGAPLAPSRVLSMAALRPTRPATQGDLGRVIADFDRSAGLIVEAGFDAIEVHVGHGYLLSSFLSPRLNRRHDEWGGSVARRAELARRVLGAVRRRVGAGVAVLAKLNMLDGVRGGLEMYDALEVARLIEADGTVDALVLTGGSSFQNPMFLLRGEVPTRELAANFAWPIRVGMHLAGGRFLRRYPFAEGFFLEQAARFRAELSMPLVALGGINRLETVQSALDSGFEFVALGRALLHEPSLVQRWASGDRRNGGCIHCNRCVPTIYTGTRCPEVGE